MAKRLSMGQISSILTLHQSGHSNRQIAKLLGVHRETVAKHLADQPVPAEPDHRARPGPASDCEPFREIILAKLEKGLTGQRIYQDLRDEEDGFSSSYSSLRRFVTKLRRTRELPFRRMETEPGDEAQVDFGTGAWVAGSDGKRKRPWVFRIVLSHSRKAYSEAVWKQSTESFNRLSHSEFLELVLADELAVRYDRLVTRRTKAASFREQKTLEDFDWSFNRAIKKKPIYDLAAGGFVRQNQDALLVGPPGVGKSHLAQAIGLTLVKAGYTVLYRSIFDAVRDFLHDEAFEGHDRVMAKYLKPDLLILDDMGMKQLPKRSGEYLFEIIMRRHELKSTMMTSNRPLEDWGKLIGDVPAATAILDRLLEDAQIIQITGKSYRIGRRTAKGKTAEN